jgi:hypothetical protein
LISSADTAVNDSVESKLSYDCDCTKLCRLKQLKVAIMKIGCIFIVGVWAVHDSLPDQKLEVLLMKLGYIYA